MFNEVFNRIHEQTCLEAYAKGYKDALENLPDSFKPGVYNSKLYIQHYREGFVKGMTDKNDIESQATDILKAS